MTSVEFLQKGEGKEFQRIGLKRKENTKIKKKSKLRYLKEGTESNGEEKSLKFSAGGM